MRERSQKMKPTSQKSPESRDNEKRKIENNYQQGISHTKTFLRTRREQVRHQNTRIHQTE